MKPCGPSNAGVFRQLPKHSAQRVCAIRCPDVRRRVACDPVAHGGLDTYLPTDRLESIAKAMRQTYREDDEIFLRPIGDKIISSIQP